MTVYGIWRSRSGCQKAEASSTGSFSRGFQKAKQYYLFSGHPRTR